MLGGAHALWLLEGTNRAGQQKRTLNIAHAEFENDRKMIHDIATMATDDPVAGLAEAEPYLSQRDESIEAAIAAGSTLGMTRGQVCARIDETTLLTEATNEMAQRGLRINTTGGSPNPLSSALDEHHERIRAALHAGDRQTARTETESHIVRTVEVIHDDEARGAS